MSATTIQEVNQVYSTGRTRSVRWRLSQLAALQQMLEEHAGRFETALREDLGKSGFEAWVSEIGQVLEEITWLRKHAAAWAKPQRVRTPMALWPATSKIEHEPRGTVLVISPWNYPVMLSLTPLAGAVAAGKAVVLKPSEISTAVEATLAELIPQYLDPHAVRVVTGGPEAVHDMIDAGPQHVFFTGSSRVGAIIAQACAKRHINYTLELGGQSPVYVHHDANIKTAATRLVWGKFFNAGQTCVAPNHVYVHQDVAAQLREAIVAEVPRQFGPQPVKNPDYPRMITTEHAQAVADLLVATNGEVVHGGTVDTAQRYIEPTIVTDVAETDAVMSRELFGPVLPLVTVTGPEDALGRISKRENPLACYLFTESQAVKDHFLPRVVAGGIGINVPVMHVATPHLPFGGVGPSGTGQYHGKWSLQTFSQERAVLDKSTRFDTIKLITQPVPAWANWAVRRLMSAGAIPAKDLHAARTFRADGPR